MSGRAQIQLLPPRVQFVDPKTGLLTKEAYRALQQIPELQARLAAVEEESILSAVCLIETKFAETVETAQYTTPARTRATVDAFSAYNSTAGALVLTVRAVPAGETPGAQHIVAAPTIAAGATYTFPELVGQTLEPGDFISVLPAAAGIAIRAAGRAVST